MKDDPAEVILIMAWSMVSGSFIIIIMIDRFLKIVYNARGGWVGAGGFCQQGLS